MFNFLGRQLSVIIPTFFGITLLSFILIRLVPGDPVLLMIGERGAAPEVYNSMKEQMGLNKPLLTQYGIYIKNALQGDLGNSVVSQLPVTKEFWGRFPATLELGLVAMLFSIVLGIPLGIMAAVRRNSFFDYSFMTVSLVGYSMPIFWWGLILILVFSVTFGITPVSGRIDVAYDIPNVTGFLMIDTLLSDDGLPAFWDAFKHLILPSVAMGTIPLAVVSRMTRSALLEVLGEDYIRAAKAKGLSVYKIIWVHALRNALIPVITVIGLLFGSIVTGAILTETIFSWPGIGKWLVKSVTSRDYPVIQGGILLIAIMIVFINLAVDAINAYINPKMRGLK